MSNKTKKIIYKVLGNGVLLVWLWHFVAPERLGWMVEWQLWSLGLIFFYCVAVLYGINGQRKEKADG